MLDRAKAGECDGMELKAYLRNIRIYIIIKSMRAL